MVYHILPYYGDASPRKLICSFLIDRVTAITVLHQTIFPGGNIIEPDATNLLLRQKLIEYIKTGKYTYYGAYAVRGSCYSPPPPEICASKVKRYEDLLEICLSHYQSTNAVPGAYDQ